jgi:glutaredoxin
MERKKDKKLAKKSDNTPDIRPDNKIRIAVVLLAIAILGCALFYGSSLLTAAPVSASSAGVNASITATFFYGNGCSHCEKVKPLIADIQARYPELHVEMLEVNDNKTNRQQLTDMVSSRKGSPEWSLPVIFIGDDVLMGETEVEDHFEEKVLAGKQKLQNAVPALVRTSPSGSNVTVNAVFFYSDSCSHCENVKPFIANISSRYPDLNLTRLEISYNADNRQDFNDMSSWYGIPNPGVPTIFIGNSVLIGEVEIKNQFEGEILAENSGLPPAFRQT